VADTPDIKHSVRIVAVSGLATCDHCQELYSWLLEVDQLKSRAATLVCPTCGGSSVIDLDTIYTKLEVT